MLDVRGFVVIDGFAAIVADPMRFVVLDFDILILFGVEINLLRAFFVFEAQFVGIRGRTTLGRAGQNAGLRHIGRQRIGRHVVTVVDAAYDQGLIGVAFQKFDHHFMTDARNGNHAPVLAGPGMRHPDPA